MTIEASMPKVTAPFTADQVASLNAYQMCGFLHEFTCGNPDCPGEQAILIATERGWECPADCGYEQDWAHGIMADWSWRARGIMSPLSRITVQVGDGPPVSGEVVTVDVVSACCGADAARREGEGWPPWTCTSCWEPCGIRLARKDDAPENPRGGDAP